jgi:hypothetical protein
MCRNFIFIGFVILLLLFVACNERSQERKGYMHNELEKYCESKYLKEYFKENSTSGEFYVDSIDVLYKSLQLYKINDSTLVFTSFYRNEILLIITPDSIRIYHPKGEDPWWRGLKPYLFEESGINPVVKYIEKETVPFFKNSWWDNVQVIIGYYKNDSSKIILLDYRKSARYSDEFSMRNNAYNYYTTVKNDLINLRGVKLINYWKFNDNLILQDNIINKEPSR